MIVTNSVLLFLISLGALVLSLSAARENKPGPALVTALSAVVSLVSGVLQLTVSVEGIYFFVGVWLSLLALIASGVAYADLKGHQHLNATSAGVLWAIILAVAAILQFVNVA